MGTVEEKKRWIKIGAQSKQNENSDSLHKLISMIGCDFNMLKKSYDYKTIGNWKWKLSDLLFDGFAMITATKRYV